MQPKNTAWSETETENSVSPRNGWHIKDSLCFHKSDTDAELEQLVNLNTICVPTAVTESSVHRNLVNICRLCAFFGYWTV